MPLCLCLQAASSQPGGYAGRGARSSLCFSWPPSSPLLLLSPTPQVPCNSCGMPILSLDGCLLALPTTPHGKPGAIHMYRSPWDVITSAYWFHTQDPVPEEEAWLNEPVRRGWCGARGEARRGRCRGASVEAMVPALPCTLLQRPGRCWCPACHASYSSSAPAGCIPPPPQMSTVVDWITAMGVPLSELEALGAVDAGDTPFVEVLRGMAEEEAVQLQFWQMAPGEKRAGARSAGWQRLMLAGVSIPLPRCCPESTGCCACRAVFHGAALQGAEAAARQLPAAL